MHREVGPARYLGSHLGGGEVAGVSDGTSQKSGGFPCTGSPFGRKMPSNVSDAQINRGWVSLGKNFMEEGID